jgi:hypothetical protein
VSERVGEGWGEASSQATLSRVVKESWNCTQASILLAPLWGRGGGGRAGTWSASDIPPAPLRRALNRDNHSSPLSALGTQAFNA